MCKTSHRQRKLNVECIQVFFKLSSILNNFVKPCYEQSHTKNVWLCDRRKGSQRKAWNTYFVQKELKAICEQRNKNEKGLEEKITKRLTKLNKCGTKTYLKQRVLFCHPVNTGGKAAWKPKICSSRICYSQLLKFYLYQFPRPGFKACNKFAHILLPLSLCPNRTHIERNS